PPGPPAQLDRAPPQPHPPGGRVDGADPAPPAPPDVAADPSGLGQPGLEGGPARGRSLGDHAIAVPDRRDRPEQRAPLAPLDRHRVRRRLPPHDLGLVDPEEVGAVEVAIALADLDPVPAGGPGRPAPRRSGPAAGAPAPPP